MKQDTKKFLIGLGIGLSVGGAIGGTTTYFVSKRKIEKRIRKERKDELRRVREEAYDEGFDEGTEQTMVECQRWIDQNTMRINTDDPEGSLKAINDHIKASKGNSDTGVQENTEAVKTAFQGQTEVCSEGSKSEESEEKPKEDPIIPDMPKQPEEVDEIASLKIMPNNEVAVFWRGRIIAVYPRQIFFNDVGDTYDDAKIRARLIEYEKNIKILKNVWMAFGWGMYFPDPTIGAPTAEEIDNWDLSLGDEPEQRSEERERYLEEVERYKEHPEEAPRIISRQEFDEECYLDKIYVDFYTDNVFIENTDVDKPLDPFVNFGVTDGNELFKNAEQREDRDIVHVKNFKMNFVAEITRSPLSYASIADGSAYLDGGTGIR